MIHNPYAKKRPRPSGWASSSSSLSTSTTMAKEPTVSITRDKGKDSFAIQNKNSRIGPRDDGPLDREDKTVKQSNDSCKRLGKNNLDRIGNEFKPSGNLTNDNSEYSLGAQKTSKVASAMTCVTTSQPLESRPNPYTKITSKNLTHNNVSLTNRASSITSTTPNPSLKRICNPYMKRNIIKPHIGVSTAKSSTLHENDNHLVRNVHSNTYTGVSSIINSRNATEKLVDNSSIQISSKSSRIEKCQPESKVSCLVRSSKISETVFSKALTKLPSSMASIRPASWKPNTDYLHNRSRPSFDLPSSNSMRIEQKLSTQPYKNITSENLTQSQTRKIEDTIDRLPTELSYIPDEVKPIQDEYRMLLIKNAQLSAPLKNGWMLFPHQRKAIIRSLTMRRMILALDMGLGKTLIGAVWSKAFKVTFGQDKLKVYVICPVSLREEWKRTAEGSVGLDVEEEGRGKSKAKNKRTAEKRKNHENSCTSEPSEESIVGKPSTNMKMTICSWGKVPKVVESNVENFVVCCDEAHAMQSAEAQRTKDVLNLVADKRCVGVLLLTGTPMKNGKPCNLFPLLKAVRHPLGRHQKAYEAHFCNGMLKNFGRGPQWDATGASNLDQLRRKVASNLLHMTKEECLTELPPMTTVFKDVPVSSRYQLQYEHSIKYLASVQANSSNVADEAVLGAVQRLRNVCAHAKVEATVEMTRTILNKEPAVVIFTYFTQVAKNVRSQLETSGWPCSLLTGETPQKKRQELVDNFQNGLSSVFVCTFGAGGVGLTLTAAATVILLDRPWTPGETRQAEDRIRRIGQVKKCTSYWMRSFDLDKQIDGMLESKKQTTNAVLDKNQDKTNVVRRSAKISINQLVQKFVLSEATRAENPDLQSEGLSLFKSRGNYA